MCLPHMIKGERSMCCRGTGPSGPWAGRQTEEVVLVTEGRPDWSAGGGGKGQWDSHTLPL